ncbi:hypothetical protein [Streptomyces sp. CB01881]|uniref:hypothetical protein n=1 Tax=Streptomyces sp. CB01881 TaxID=2078691 RepID=UPI0018837CB0|nr:hypothetical protein [Streptomyces sp. CB01881]
MTSSRRVRVRAGVVLAAALTLVAGCSSSPGGSLPSGGASPSGAPSAGGSGGPSSAAVATLRQSLAAFERPLSGDDAQRALEGLSAALDGAVAQGVDQGTIDAELVIWELRQLSTPEGGQTYLANGAALAGHVLRAAEPSPSAAPTLGAGAAAYRDTPNGGAGLSFYFVNGVLNNFDSSTRLKQLLEESLTRSLGFPVHINLAFNPSSLKIADYVASTCREATRVTKDHPIKEAEGLVQSVCVLTGFGAGVLPVAVTTDFIQSITQKVADPNFASDPVNVKLLGDVQNDLQQGKRVVLISHSQGGLFLRNVLPRIGAGQPVGALLIAPPYGTGQELAADPTRYVMFEHDWLLEEGVSHVDPTVVAAEPQTVYDGSTYSTFTIHYLNNYLYCGSASEKQIGDRAREVVAWVNSVPASRGGARPELPASPWASPRGDGLPAQAPTCPAPPAGSETPTPTESPSTPATESPATESPTAESPTAESPTATPTESPTESATAVAAYYVFVLTNVATPGNILVGTLQDVVGKRTCDFTDGGLCADAGGQDVPVQYTPQLGPFPTLQDAQAAYCANAANPHTGPGGAGTKVDIFGDGYWADNIDFACPAASPTR